jgi:Spy/CpxP family protein refolding chaperone
LLIKYGEHPMKRNFAKSLMTLLALGPILALAQRPLPPDPSTMIQHRVNFLTNQLGLSSSQQQQATTIFTNAMTRMQPLHDQIHSAHQALQAAVATGDNAAIEQTATTIGNLTAQQIAAHAKADAQFFQILSSDQQAKFTQMRGHGPGERGFGRRFGHGGPPE